MPLFFKLLPRNTKSVTELEIWENGIYRIERYIGWRYGVVVVDSKSDLRFINKRTANALVDVCLSDHLIILDQRLQVSFCEDLIYDEKLSQNERLKIEEAYTKSEEDALYDKGWEIVEKKLYFMGEVEIIPHNKNTL